MSARFTHFNQSKICYIGQVHPSLIDLQARADINNPIPLLVVVPEKASSEEQTSAVTRFEIYIKNAKNGCVMET